MLKLSPIQPLELLQMGTCVLDMSPLFFTTYFLPQEHAPGSSCIFSCPGPKPVISPGSSFNVYRYLETKIWALRELMANEVLGNNCYV